MRWFLKRLFRERRRLAIVAILTFLAGYLAFYKNDNTVFGWPMPLVASVGFMVPLTLSFAILVSLFPKVRHAAESCALSLPVLSLMGAFSDASDGGIATSSNVLGILFVYLFATLYAGPWLDRYLPRRTTSLAMRQPSCKRVRYGHI